MPFRSGKTMPFYENWSMKYSPFARVDRAAHFFSGRPQREALARLHYLVDSGHSTGLLINDWGCGATRLLRHVAGSAGFGDTAVDVALTNGRLHRGDDVLRALAAQLGASESCPSPWQTVFDRTVASARQHVRTLWLIDDGTSEAAEWAGRLTSENPWVTAIVTASLDEAGPLVTALGACPLRIDLEPLDVSDTMDFLHEMLAAAGGSAEIFSDSAMIRLHELAEGRIAVIGQLAELAMQTAAHHGLHRIGSDLVEAIQGEFVRAAA